MFATTPKELECTLCHEMFRNPKTLDCLHSFCLQCLESLVQKSYSMKPSCPICRTPIQTQLQQLEDLPTDLFLLNSLNNFKAIANSVSEQNAEKILCSDGENEAISYCIECETYLCEFCTRTHKTGKITKCHGVSSIQGLKNQNGMVSIPNPTTQMHCQLHQEEVINSYCEDCKFPICQLCLEEHHSHTIVDISKKVGSEKQFLYDLIDKMKEKKHELEEGYEKCEFVIKQLELNSTEIQIQISGLFENIRKQLNLKEEELLNELDCIERAKKKELEVQKEELKFGIESIIGSCQIIENSLSLSTDDTQLVFMNKQYCSRLNYLANFQWKTQPRHNPLVLFSVSDQEEESIYSCITNIGKINSYVLSGEKCLISKNEKRKAHENGQYSFEIISYSKEGKRIETGGSKDRFTIKVEGEPETRKVEPTIIDLNNGNYQVRMKIKDQGKYLISVQYDDIDLPSSPFLIEALPKPKSRKYFEIGQPKATFGSGGNGDGQFDSPTGIAINSKGNILICDNGNHRIQIFDSEGNFISSFGSLGDGNGQFHDPEEIVVNSKDQILVSDHNNHRIQIFDPEGHFLSTFGLKGTGNGEFENPYGIAVDTNDNIFVFDCHNHRIQAFDPQGNFLFKFGSHGEGDGQFGDPFGIVINSIGNILVSDSSNNNIQIFDSQGNFISKFGSSGNGDGEFNDPYGLSVDIDDNILVCDFRNNRVQVFDPQGNFMTKFSVCNPIRIEIDPTTRNILVCEWLGNRISIY